jgi:hypothetical protein
LLQPEHLSCDPEGEGCEAGTWEVDEGAGGEGEVQGEEDCVPEEILCLCKISFGILGWGQTRRWAVGEKRDENYLACAHFVECYEGKSLREHCRWEVLFCEEEGESEG